MCDEERVRMQYVVCRVYMCSTLQPPCALDCMHLHSVFRLLHNQQQTSSENSCLPESGMLPPALITKHANFCDYWVLSAIQEVPTPVQGPA